MNLISKFSFRVSPIGIFFKFLMVPIRYYKYLNNSHVSPQLCALTDIKKKEFVVQQKQISVSFHVYPSLKKFYQEYLLRHPSERCFNEIILPGWQKFRIDVDEKISEKDLFRLIKYVYKILHKIHPLLFSLGEILVYDIQRSYHLVINNLVFESSGCCCMLANILLEYLSKKLPNITRFIDLEVYKDLQMFRIEGSTKYLDYRWKYPLGKQQISSFKNFKKGLISYTKGNRKVDTDWIIDYALKIHLYFPSLSFKEDKKRIEKEKKKEKKEEEKKEEEKIDLSLFSIRERKNNIIVLNRIQPSYCSSCQRIHENENPYYVHGKIFCRRNN